MNICMLVSNFLPRQGGAEYAVHHLTSVLLERGHRVTIVTGNNPTARTIRFPYPVLHCSRLPVVSLETQRRLHAARILRQERFDLIHAHIAWEAGYVGAQLKRKTGLPLVTTCHGGDVQVVPGIEYGLCLNPDTAAKVRFALENSDRITAVSRRMIRAITDRGGDPGRIRPVPYGTELAKIDAVPPDSIREKLNLAPSDFVLLSVGRNSRVKDMPTLIEGFRIAAESDSSIKAILVGPDEEIRRMVREKRLEDRVRVLGRIPTGYDPRQPTEQVFATPYPEMIAAYRASDVYVATSYIESFNMSALDAFACGRPVIITNTHGFMDALEEGKNGFSVPVRDPAAVAEKILVLARNRALCLAMGEAARRKAAEYDWEQVVDRYVAVYEEALATVRTG